MNIHADKSQESKGHVVLNEISEKMKGSEPSFHFADNRPEATTQKTLQKMEINSLQAKQSLHLQSIANSNSTNLIQKQGKKEEELLQGKFEPVQKQENKTGLPDNLKSGIENLSGIALDDVKVHYNSDKPAGLQAHAFAQGTDIHVASGQEKHLPHEAWHLVQQKQGRVKPTMQMKGRVNINDDKGLESEADVMGSKAIVEAKSLPNNKVTQLGKKKRDIQNAKKNNPNGIQHHLRPEYQQQNEIQMGLINAGMDRKEAKRQAKQNVRKKK